MSHIYSESPIGYIESPYVEKFGIPRQSGIISTVESKIRLSEEFAHENFVRGLEHFSHLWILFKFHENIDKGFSPLVRPPRLGGNKKIGVFASRSPFRPNFIGISAVELVDIKKDKGLYIIVKGGDFANKTPVIDIKPYIKFADCVENAVCGEFQNSPEAELKVFFSDKCMNICYENPKLYENIKEILSYDIRPAYYKNQKTDKMFGMEFERFNIKFKVEDKVVYIEDITKT